MSETEHPPEEYAARARKQLGYSRWWQVVAAMVMMALVSPYQYVWSSIEGPLAADFSASLSTIGFVFTAYVVIMSLTQFPAGWWRDRYGPRTLSVRAGVLAGGGYYGLAYATEVWHIFVFYGIGAVGVGIVYTVAVNTALKWFPDKRGLTTGLGTMAFGGGSALLVPYVRANATLGNYTTVLEQMGALIAVGVIVGALILCDPPTGWTQVVPDGGEDEPPETTRQHQFTYRKMLGTWQFYVLYLMFFFVSAAGLMITARIVLFAEYSGLSVGIATLAATVLPLASGGGRLVVGAISDWYRREVIMAISFFVCGLGVLVVVLSGGIDSNIGFIVGVVVSVFFWSSQFSLFPSLVADYYGTEHSSSNYAVVYSAKMWGGVFGGGVVGWLVGISGWNVAFLIGAALALLAGLAGVVLRPPKQRVQSQ